MGYNKQAQAHIDEMHLMHPQPGDFWHEMYCPIVRVLGSTDEWIILQKVGGMGGQEISDTDPKPRAMKKSAFKKWISYNSIPGTWAHVLPKKYPPQTIG